MQNDPSANTDSLLTGQVLRFDGNPFEQGQQVAKIERRGAVLIRDGKILDSGTAERLVSDYPAAQRVDYGDHLILPGFVDAHVHYPQTGIIASWGKRLIDWLNSYTFPEEMRFADRSYADEIAERYLDLTLSHGTTTMASYCTIHPESVDAFFTAAQQRGHAGDCGQNLYGS